METHPTRDKSLSLKECLFVLWYPYLCSLSHSSGLYRYLGSEPAHSLGERICAYVGLHCVWLAMVVWRMCCLCFFLLTCLVLTIRDCIHRGKSRQIPQATSFTFTTSRSRDCPLFTPKGRKNVTSRPLVNNGPFSPKIRYHILDVRSLHSQVQD